MPEIKETTHLKDLWNEAEAQKMSGNQLLLLRYRSNLLGADLRITNFGGGNTSSKVELPILLRAGQSAFLRSREVAGTSDPLLRVDSLFCISTASSN